MKTKLSENINTFFNNTKSNVSSLVREMKLDKADFTALAKKMANSSSFNEFSTAKVVPFSQLLKEPVLDLFRDSSIRIGRLFNSSNAAGIFLDSMSNVLGADIQKLEEDIKNLELFINNYEFLAGKDDLYNGNYIEKFDNTISDYRYDGYNFSIPDRNNVSFPENGNVYIDTKIGVMKIGSGQKSYNIIKNIKNIKIVNNYSNYITSDSPFANLFNETLKDSWSVTVKSPTVLTSDLSEYNKYINYGNVPNGAKTAIELDLKSPIHIDTLRFNPNLGNDLQILQVVLFDQSNASINNQIYVQPTTYSILLSAPKTVNSATEIVFEKQRVNKILLIFNQGSYVRNKKTPLTSELNSKAMNQFVLDRLNENKEKFSKFQDIAYWFFKRRYEIKGIKTNKNSDIEYYSYRFPESLHTYAKFVENELIKASNISKQDNPVFVNSPIFMDLVRSMLSVVGGDKKFLNLGYFIDSQSYGYNSSGISNPGFIGTRRGDELNNPRYQSYIDTNAANAQATIKNMFIQESEDTYEYSFSLLSIDLIETTSSETGKACFVSRKIPVDGQVLAVKAKVDTLGDSVSLVENSYNINKYISYELSISNVDYPVLETDWIPLAFNGNSIDSEVVFFDTTTYSTKLRFKPYPDSVILYKDGMIISPSKYEYSSASDRLILKDSLQYSPTSIFCVSYLINDSVYDPYEIDFLKYNIYQESVKHYRSDSGLGQVFSKTNGESTVELEYNPYVNSSAVSGANYDYIYGTIFLNSFSGYSPVKVMLSDGSYAVNVTNYTRSPQKVEFTNNGTIQFIHTGKNIIFNTNINDQFTVMYEYVPFSLRFRFVVRKNIPGIQFPGKVDSVLIKMKTSQFDPFYDKLIYVSKG